MPPRRVTPRPRYADQMVPRSAPPFKCGQRLNLRALVKHAVRRATTHRLESLNACGIVPNNLVR
eukprot:3103210-Pyramimonas_sp.AAC.1